MRFFFWDEFHFVPISFGSMVKFQYLAQFQVDHLSPSVIPSLVIRLYPFAAFAYYVIKRLLPISTKPIVA